jgi:hypothetical protein
VSNAGLLLRDLRLQRYSCLQLCLTPQNLRQTLKTIDTLSRTVRTHRTTSTRQSERVRPPETVRRVDSASNRYSMISNVSRQHLVHAGSHATGLYSHRRVQQAARKRPSPCCGWSNRQLHARIICIRHTRAVRQVSGASGSCRSHWPYGLKVLTVCLHLHYGVSGARSNIIAIRYKQQPGVSGALDLGISTAYLYEGASGSSARSPVSAVPPAHCDRSCANAEVMRLPSAMCMPCALVLLVKYTVT